MEIMFTTRESDYNQKVNLRNNANTNTRKKGIATADYLADMILELRNMAKSEGQKTLQGLLEMAYYEAFSLANPIEIDAEERQRLRELESVARAAMTADAV